MPKVSVEPAIHLRGVRHNNLKNFDLDLPLNRFVVITGPSGSGKSSLAFDTLFAEGQRRYIETFSPYARQFFDRMDKPAVDRIDGIPPAIAIEQRNTVRTTRSTVGTMTEICDHLKLLWPHLAELYCVQCGRRVRQDTPQSIWTELSHTGEVTVTFELPLSAKLSLAESLALVERQGYQRLWLNDTPVRLEEAASHLQAAQTPTLTIVQDRIQLAPDQRARFAEACEQAYHFGRGKLTLHRRSDSGPQCRPFSNRLHCADCDRDYREPTAALFSFNHPLGACPTCRGFGRIIRIDYHQALPDRTKTLAQGAVRPWQTGQGLECQRDLLKFCRACGIPTDVPFAMLSPEHQRWVIEGDPDYGSDPEHEWPRAWYGVKGYFRWLESKAYKMHVRVLLARYRAYSTCPDCQGGRFQPEVLPYRITPRLAEPIQLPGRDPTTTPQLTLPGFYRLPIRDALRVVEALVTTRSASLGKHLTLVLDETRQRLSYLVEVGLEYLTLERPTRTLSGGETERVNLTSCLGTRLVNTLYVLDEPSVGLHHRDTGRLVTIVKKLRDLGNTVVVVEHDPGVARAADQIIDLGPGHGESGGQIVFQGTPRQILKTRKSLTGLYLSGHRTATLQRHRPVHPETTRYLRLEGASRHNLKHLDVRFPLARLVGITGVSGSGKSTLVREILHPLLELHLQPGTNEPQPNPTQAPTDDPDLPASQSTQNPARLFGAEQISQVLLVDQSPLGRTPRSNPAVYVGAFDYLRELFARSDLARQRGLNASAFSFNSLQGQCERCRGAGFEKIEMQFLSDVFIRCPECEGNRYRPHILEIRVAPSSDPSATRNIADILAATVDQTVNWLDQFPPDGPARRATEALRSLQDVGLGYLRLGQPINTLSGGECQRLKLAAQLAEFHHQPHSPARPSLFLLDEPTTGLHADDVRVLLLALHTLVDAGHSVLVIEHNLDVIRSADWVIDLGPEAGEQGGRIVAEGPPEHIAACPHSHTGRALAETSPSPS